MQGELDTILDALIDCRFDDDPTAPVVFADMQTLVTIRNVIDALAAAGPGTWIGSGWRRSMDTNRSPC